MRLSSIFSFRTYQARLRFTAWPIYLLILIIVAEVTLRLPAVANQLPQPEPTLWHAELIQAKLDYLKAFEAEQGIDVLFIGNSTVQAGINPEVFDLVRKNSVQTGEGAFNAAIEGLPPYAILTFLEIYLRYTQPKAIIYGITAQDLNSNSPWAKDIMDRVEHSPLAQAEARRGWQGKLTAYMLDYSYLYRYRFVLHQLLLRGGKLPELPEIYFDTRGYHPISRRLSDVPANNRGRYYNSAGVLNYSAQGVQKDALRELIKLTSENNIPLILVNMPLADDYYGNFDSLEDYQAYLSTASQLAEEENIPFWDLENLPANSNFNDTQFADFNHLNRHGAKRLSTLIAERLTQTKQISSKLENQ